MLIYYTVCHFTGFFYAVVRQISMLFNFIDNKDSVFCTTVGVDVASAPDHDLLVIWRCFISLVQPTLPFEG